MRKQEIIQAVMGNTEKFKKDLFNRLKGEVFEDAHQIQERLETLAKEMVIDYIYFESREVDNDLITSTAESIIKKHQKAFIELAK